MRHHYLRPAQSRRYARRCRPCPPPSRNSWATCFSRIGKTSRPPPLIFLLTLPSRRCNGTMLHYHVEEPARRVMAPAGGSCVGSCIILPRDYDENTIPLH